MVTQPPTPNSEEPDRNRLSLARLQWVAWFIILFSGYFVLAVLNTHNGGNFPEMDAKLFGLLGIVTGSAVVSNLIVDAKKSDPQKSGTGANPAAPAPTDPASQQIGTIDRNAGPEQASWADLYLGEEVANRGVVDVSRLQQLVLTVLLIIVYVQALWGDLGTAAGSGSLASLPKVNSTFLELLGASHAGYLAYKATPKTSPGQQG